MEKDVHLKEKSGKNPKWLDEFSSYMGDEDADKQSSDRNNFAKLLEEQNSQVNSAVAEGEVLSGKVVHISEDFVTVDIGKKAEGFVATSEFRNHDGTVNVNVGDQIDVYMDRVDSSTGMTILSKDKAEIIKAWDKISDACENDKTVEGIVIGKVKGGLTVDIGVKAFLPGSHIDAKPVKNLDRYIGKRYTFKVIKFNKKRGNIVLSRKTLAQQELDESKTKVLAQLQEGSIVQGTIKNLTEYGAFVDLGGIDGLLHITDMSWGRVKNPGEVFQVGDEVKVMVLKYDKDKERVSLGLKQIMPNPWDDISKRFVAGQKVTGKVISVKEYGAFVELEDGIEGLIHVSEMSWTQKVKHPSKVVNVGDKVDAQILDIDTATRRISLGLKQLETNPWDILEQKYPVGSIVEGVVKNITDFGIFVDVNEGIDGLVHISDMSWAKKNSTPSERYKKGDHVRAVVLAIDKEAEKFSLGVKQLEQDPWQAIGAKFGVGSIIEGKVTKLVDFGAFVEVEENVEGLVYISEISEQRIEKPSDILKLGDSIRAEVINIDTRERRIGLSIKALKRTEERAEIAAYSKQDEKRTALGDVLGEELKDFMKKDSK